MLPLLSLVTGPVGKIAGYAALGVAILAGSAYAVHQHDARVRAELVAAQQAAAIATIQADNARAVSALEARASDAEAKAAKVASIRTAIHDAPKTSACASAPAVRAALDGLRVAKPADR